MPHFSREALLEKTDTFEQERKEREREWRTEKLQALAAQESISQQAQSLQEQITVSRDDAAKVVHSPRVTLL